MLPELKVGRFDHSSTSVRDQIFVACGLSATGLVNSIEMLDMGTNRQMRSWQLIDIESAVFSPRSDIVFCQINQDQLLILGGESST